MNECWICGEKSESKNHICKSEETEFMDVRKELDLIWKILDDTQNNWSLYRKVFISELEKAKAQVRLAISKQNRGMKK